MVKPHELLRIKADHSQPAQPVTERIEPHSKDVSMGQVVVSIKRSRNELDSYTETLHSLE